MTDSDKITKKSSDQFLGDDAGFLSWLGIDIVSPKKASKKAPKEEVVVEEKKPEEVKTPEKEHIPSLREARVISREEPQKQQVQKKKEKARNEVDELIKKKSWVDELWGGSILFTRGAPRGAAPAKWRWRWAPRRWSGRGDMMTGSSATVQIWATRQVWGAQQSSHERKEKTYKVSDSLKKKWTITVGDSVTVKEFSEKMGIPLPEVMKVLLANKIVKGAQASIDFDTANLIASEFDVVVEKEAVQTNVTDILEVNLQAILDQDKSASDLMSRPPIVTIMWHVDHGKTKLLDHLRKTDVVAGEAGWITQSIGASQITHNGQKITFIDTPGHELFTAIRARGSKITNIVIIVVAADDGVKPQTVEAISHAKEAGVPIIVAITKIDLWVSRMDEIKWQLAEHGLQPEERGGEVMIIPCSSMTWQGVDDLLDAVLLQYEMLELKYSPARNAVGVVIEAHKDTKQWVTTTLLVMTWTLHIGDIIVVHNTYGKVRRMMDRTGKQIKQATGWDPVMILGIQDLPEPGRVVETVDSEKLAIKKIEAIAAHEHTMSKDAILQNIMERIGKWDNTQLKLIIKADSFGSLEAAKQAALKATLPENVELKIIHSDVGSISDSDLVFAQASQALVVWFNVSASSSLKKKADHMGVQVKEYDIIYEFIDYIEQLWTWMIKVEAKEVLLGKLEVLGVFFKKAKEMVFGGKVLEGKAMNWAKFRVYRPSDPVRDDAWNEIAFTTWTVTSLQKEQQSVKEVKEWHECWMKVKVGKRVEVWDLIEFYVIE